MLKKKKPYLLLVPPNLERLANHHLFLFLHCVRRAQRVNIVDECLLERHFSSERGANLLVTPEG